MAKLPSQKERLIYGTTERERIRKAVGGEESRTRFILGGGGGRIPHYGQFTDVENQGRPHQLRRAKRKETLARTRSDHPPSRKI